MLASGSQLEPDKYLNNNVHCSYIMTLGVRGPHSKAATPVVSSVSLIPGVVRLRPGGLPLNLTSLLCNALITWQLRRSLHAMDGGSVVFTIVLKTHEKPMDVGD
jgi:hypothetical protein